MGRLHDTGETVALDLDDVLTPDTDPRLQAVIDILDARQAQQRQADPLRPLNHSERKKLARLRRRLDYLTTLIEDDEANGWDQGEAAALAWVIKAVTDLRPERADSRPERAEERAS